MPKQYAPAKKFSMEDVLHHYGAISIPTYRTSWRSMRCPFHDDKQASARVNFEYGQFKCLTCQVAGDAYNIVMHMEGVGFAQAKQFLEGIAGVSDDELPQPAPERSLPLFG